MLSRDDLHHLSAVRRLRPGETVVVADGRGRWRRCVVAAGAGGGTGGSAGSAGAAGGQAESGSAGSGGRRRKGQLAELVLVPDGPVVADPAPAPPITVGFSPAKGERTEWAVAKLTELGVDRMILLDCERTVVRPGDAWFRGRLDRLRRVAREAAAQSRRADLPELSPPASLASVLAALPPGSVALAEPGGGPPSLETPVVLVGPEGGWSPAERSLADEHGVATVSLSPGVLRVETAAVAAGTLLSSLRAGIVAQATRTGQARSVG